MKAAIQVLRAALLLNALAACQGAYLMEFMQGQGEARTAKAITAFSFVSPPAPGTIDENAKTIAVKVPYGTNVTALVATFTTTGSSVKVGSTVQVSGTTPNNFTSPVIYTVTAADGSTVYYTVTVTVVGGSGSGGYITESDLVGTWTVSFQWSGRTPAVFTMVINSDHTYQVPAAPGVGASSGTLSISINGNSITMVESGPSSERRTWTGTAASSTRFTGTLHTYSGDNTGTFDACKQVGGSSAKAITAFLFAILPATGTIDENAKAITVTVPYGTDVGRLQTATRRPRIARIPKP